MKKVLNSSEPFLYISKLPARLTELSLNIKEVRLKFIFIWMERIMLCKGLIFYA